LIVPSRASWRNKAISRPIGETEQPSLHHVEVDMPIVVRMKVILSPPGLILKERPRTEAGFTKTQAAGK